MMSRWDASEADGRESLDESPAAHRVWTLSILLFGAGVIAFVAVACGLVTLLPDEQPRPRAHDLKHFALLYHKYYAAYGKAPSGLADLESFTPEKSFAANPSASESIQRVCEVVRGGGFLVIWDAVLYPDSDTNNQYVFGYEPNASSVGGLVMRAGGFRRVLERIQPIERVVGARFDFHDLILPAVPAGKPAGTAGRWASILRGPA